MLDWLFGKKEQSSDQPTGMEGQPKYQCEVCGKLADTEGTCDCGGMRMKLCECGSGKLAKDCHEKEPAEGAANM